MLRARSGALEPRGIGGGSGEERDGPESRERAVNSAGSADPNLVAIEACRITERRGPTGSTVASAAYLRRFDRDAPALVVYDGLLTGAAR